MAWPKPPAWAQEKPSLSQVYTRRSVLLKAGSQPQPKAAAASGASSSDMPPMPFHVFVDRTQGAAFEAAQEAAGQASYEAASQAAIQGADAVVRQIIGTIKEANEIQQRVCYVRPAYLSIHLESSNPSIQQSICLASCPSIHLSSRSIHLSSKQSILPRSCWRYTMCFYARV